MKTTGMKDDIWLKDSTVSDMTPTVELDSWEFDCDKEVGVGLLAMESAGPSFLSELVSTSFPGVTVEAERYNDEPDAEATLCNEGLTDSVIT